ncbi:MAG: PLP-dependent aminotransferase family protein [Clostridiales bacterium]|nr:PLP-dependent aminotransferase family protein [Clostridiales bacterium]
MNYPFSDKISTLKPSAIREIFKVLENPEVISFAGGNPDPETFPAKEMSKIAERLFETNAAGALQYGITEGFMPLRELTAKRLKEKYQVGTSDDSLIITSGGQQAIELFTKVMVNEGDVIFCENPSFIGALNAFRSYNVKLVGIDSDEGGMKMDALEHSLKTEKNVKFIYIIPTFQNPSGRTMNLERRKTMLALASKYNVMILEDNPYFELRYSGEYVPPIKSLDTEGLVLYAGSYSKILSPGIRMGFAIGPKQVIDKMVVAKQVSDVHTNQFFSMLVAEYLKNCDLDKHIEEIRNLYRSKRDLMLSELDQNFDKRVSYTRPDGGIFLWCQLPAGSDGVALCKLFSDKKVAAVPGSTFMVDDRAVCPAIRLNYSMPSKEQIIKGVKLMSEALNQYLK